ncbi:MAG: hypothetical protein R2864_11445 [Syntrophotaleaceae bacterium]
MWLETGAAKAAQKADSSAVDDDEKEGVDTKVGDWDKQVANDLFVGEAVQILADLNSPETAGSELVGRVGKIP